MKKEGIVAVSDEGRPVSNGSVMRRALLYASHFDLPVISHCEELSLLDSGSMNDSETCTRLGLRPIVPAVEEAMVARDILIAEHEKKRVHIAHVSTRGSVELIRQAKKRGVMVTCETAPHYLVMDDSDLKEEGRFKMNPPLRSKADREALIEGIKDGTIDMIATDHAPHSAEEKSRGLEKSPFGITGIETCFPVVYTKLVKTGIITLEKAIELLAKSRYDEIVELIDRDEFTKDPMGAYRDKIYSKNAPMKTAVIWNKNYVEAE